MAGTGHGRHMEALWIQEQGAPSGTHFPVGRWAGESPGELGLSASLCLYPTMLACLRPHVSLLWLQPVPWNGLDLTLALANLLGAPRAVTATHLCYDLLSLTHPTP